MKQTQWASKVLVDKLLAHVLPEVLCYNGTFVTKTLFQKAEHFAPYFQTVLFRKPLSSREESNESFVICFGYKNGIR